MIALALVTNFNTLSYTKVGTHDGSGKCCSCPGAILKAPGERSEWFAHNSPTRAAFH